MEEINYEEGLRGKVEFLHERYRKKHSHLSNFIELITKFQNSCLNFSQSLLSIANKNYQLIEEKDNSIYNVLDSLLLFIRLQSDEYNELFNKIKKYILENITKSSDDLNHKEKDLFTLYIKTRDRYNYLKNTLEKSRSDYINSVNLCEKLIFNIKSSESDPLVSNEGKDKNTKKLNSLLNNAKILENKYYKNVEEAEKIRTNKNLQEKELLFFYKEVDCDDYVKIKNLLGIFLGFAKKLYNSIFASMENLSECYQSINIINDLNDFIKKNKIENQADEPIVFMPYTPEANLTTTSISGETEENEKLLINFGVISTLREHFKNIYNDLDMEEEAKKHRLRYLSLKIFKTGPKIIFTKEEKKELISLLKIPFFRTYFIITLSKQRTNSRFKREKKLVEDLADILNLILEISEKDNNYEEAKNCIILSQTFYYEVFKDKKHNIKDKIYLFDYISDNKWLTNFAFWHGIIEFMIQKEIKKSEELNKNIIADETPEEKRKRISNISFTQLLSYANNMLEFQLNKEDVLKMVEFFVEKYNIESQMANTIYESINNTVIEKKLSIKKARTRQVNRNTTRNFRARNTLKMNLMNLIIDFEIVEQKDKNPKKNNSAKKYHTSLRLEDDKCKYIRKNNLIKRSNSIDYEESEESYNCSQYSRKVSSFGQNARDKDSANFSNMKSFDNEHFISKISGIKNYNSKISLDSNDIKFDENEKMDKNVENKEEFTVKIYENEKNDVNQINNDNNIIINNNIISNDYFLNENNKIKETSNTDNIQCENNNINIIIEENEKNEKDDRKENEEEIKINNNTNKSEDNKINQINENQNSKEDNQINDNQMAQNQTTNNQKTENIQITEKIEKENQKIEDNNQTTNEQVKGNNTNNLEELVIEKIEDNNNNNGIN